MWRDGQLDLVANGGASGLQRCLADANAQAAAGDEHGAAGERCSVEVAGHSRLPTAAEVSHQVAGYVNHGESAGLSSRHGRTRAVKAAM
jgi:hypothetical protein